MEKERYKKCKSVKYICFKINCESDNDLEQAETCRSIKYVELSCVWRFYFIINDKTG